MTDNPIDQLTDRQRAVADLMLEGHDLIAVADMLNISHGMARKLAHETYAKLGLSNQPNPRVRMVLMFMSQDRDKEAPATEEVQP